MRTGSEDDTEEDCLPKPVGDLFKDTEQENIEKIQELEADNARLRCKCKGLMKLIFSMGGTIAMINKASRASEREYRKFFEAQAKRRIRGEGSSDKKTKAVNVRAGKQEDARACS